MKIYTKTGDKGETSLIGGRRVLKSNIKIDSYGTVDELNAWIGLIADQRSAHKYQELLREIQGNLFVIGAQLASDPGKQVKELPKITSRSIEQLEQAIDIMDGGLQPLKNFILPGGSQEVSYCHVTRAVARRAERAVVALSEHEEIDELLIQYLNRLSDYLFTLARSIGKDMGVEEIPW